VYKILEKVSGCNDVGIYTKKFSDHSLKNRQTQKADNKRRKIKKLSADSDYGACYSGLGDEEMMDMPKATYQKIKQDFLNELTLCDVASIPILTMGQRNNDEWERLRNNRLTASNFAIQDRVINTRNYKKHTCGLQSIIDKCRICGTEGETIEHIISSCTVLAQSEYKKRHDIFAKIIHMNLAVKFNLLKNTQPHYSYTPESCLENDSYKLYFDRTILTDIHIKHNRPDIIILNKQQKQAYLLDIAVPNSHNITQTYNTKINKYLELSVAMRNLWCLEKISILPLVISATGIVPQSLFKNLKILDLDNTLVVEIQKGILLYSCHIVRKFLNIDTEHNTQQSHNAEARRR
jgi:hypothetical protein